MPRQCTICLNPQRLEIDAALVTGTPYRNIAEGFGTSLAALNRHRTHAAGAIVKAAERREEWLVDTLFDKMRRVQRKAGSDRWESGRLAAVVKRTCTLTRECASSYLCVKCQRSSERPWSG
jgi:hypothetical protein